MKITDLLHDGGALANRQGGPAGVGAGGKRDGGANLSVGGGGVLANEFSGSGVNDCVLLHGSP